MNAPQQPSAASASAAGATAAGAQVQSAARWFWWIAGLSLVNAVMARGGVDSQFVLGLALTEIATELSRGAPVVGLSLAAAVVGFFVWVGLQAQRGRLWAFYAGGAVYLVDALIYAAYGDWMSVGFHALALFFIVRGALALRAAAAAA